MFSTLTARPVASAVLTYLTMGALVFGTTIGFGLTAFLVTDDEDVTYFGIPDSYYERQQSLPFDPADPTLTPEQLEELQKVNQQPTRADCVEFTRRTTVAHTERIWWLLPLNPFVVVADAAPSLPRSSRDEMYAAGFTPMRWISGGVRMARNGPSEDRRDECAMQTATGPEQTDVRRPDDRGPGDGPGLAVRPGLPHGRRRRLCRGRRADRLHGPHRRRLAQRNPHRGVRGAGRRTRRPTRSPRRRRAGCGRAATGAPAARTRPARPSRTGS